MSERSPGRTSLVDGQASNHCILNQYYSGQRKHQCHTTIFTTLPTSCGASGRTKIQVKYDVFSTAANEAAPSALLNSRHGLSIASRSGKHTRF